MLDRHDLPIHYAGTESRASGGVPIPSRAWVKSAPSSASNDVWGSGIRAHDHRNGAAPRALAESAARFEARRDRRVEAHRAARLDPVEHGERLGLFLAGVLLAVLAGGAMGSAPRGAAVIVAMFAGAFMVMALAGSFRRRRNP